MSKKKLYIISASFPYGSQEVFLENELLVLSKTYDIHIIPLYNNHSEKIRTLPYPIEIHPTIIPKSKFKQGLRLLISNRFLLMDLLELFRLIGSKKVKLRTFKSYLIAVREYRLFRMSSAFKTLKKEDNSSLVYFYWCSSIVLGFKNSNRNFYVRVHGGELNEEYYEFIPFIKQKTRLKATYLPISENCNDRLTQLNSKIDSVVFRLGTFNDFANLNRTFNNDVIKIVSCSSVIPVKRVHLIVEILRNCNRNIEWVHFGDGAELDKLTRLAQESIPKNVKYNFLGRVDNSSILNYYAENEISIFINVSESEGVPVSIMEAMSFGIPCIATNVGGVAEIVNEENGFLISKTFSPQSVASLIDNLNKEELKVLSQASINTWDKEYNALKNYQKLVHFMNKTSEISQF